MIGTEAYLAAWAAEPISGWRSTMMSAYFSSVSMVSTRLSPLDTEEYWMPWVIGMVLPPRRSMAPMNEALVRVLGS